MGSPTQGSDSNGDEEQHADGDERTVSQKGQVTIPKAMRDDVGIEPGGDVWVFVEDGRVVVEPVPTLEDLHGSHAREDMAPGEVMEQVREWDREDRARDEDAAEAMLDESDDDTDDETDAADE